MTTQEYFGTEKQIPGFSFKVLGERQSPAIPEETLSERQLMK